MTKKDFEALASALHAVQPNPHSYTYTPEQYGTWDMTVQSVANVCAESNDRFNRDRFLNWCENGQ